MPSAIDRARPVGVVGDREHAREIVAAPAGQHAEHRAGHVAQRVGEHADQPVAAERDDRLAGRCVASTASSRAWSRSRVSTRRTSRPRPRSARSASGAIRPALPPPAAGLTIRQMGRAAGTEQAYWPALPCRAEPALRRRGGSRAVAPPPPDRRGDRERGDHDEQPEQDRPARGRDRRTAARRARRCRGRCRAARGSRR